MRNKKFIGLLIITAMLTSLAGCSGAETSSVSESSVAEISTEETAEETEAATEEETEAESTVDEEAFVAKDVIETADQALAKLKEGNATYVSNTKNPTILNDAIREDLTENGQNPYAVVITCGDSRVPAEHVFSAGIGDLFVIRNAGNVIGTYDVGSAEYAAEHLGTHLIVVLGHTNCGAVKSTLDGGAEGNIGAITDEIQYAIGDETDARECEWLNAKNSVARLMESPVLTELVEEGKLKIVPAVYDITTGSVVFDEEYTAEGEEESEETEDTDTDVIELEEDAAEPVETESEETADAE